MTVLIAYLGPSGTNAEVAAIAWKHLLHESDPSLDPDDIRLQPYPSIAQAIKATQTQETHYTVAPVENSTEGSVTITLDTLWQLDHLQIQRALQLPISHALLSRAIAVPNLQTIYSHPQALAQCQGWLERHLPHVQLIPTNSTTEALQHLEDNLTVGAISSQRAAQLYDLPVLAHPINDNPDNCTRFWVLSLQPSPGGQYTSLAFSVPANVPGALVKPLQVFAERNINLSRIESRPTKRSLGDYLFFLDLESGNINNQLPDLQTALIQMQGYTETLKNFGSYDLSPIQP